jgi:hypothetical protein
VVANVEPTQPEKGATLPPRPKLEAARTSGPTAAPPVTVAELSISIQVAFESIDGELATRVWLFGDPERRKALSRARDFLQRIREALDHLPGSAQELPLAATKELTDRAGYKDRRYGRENAWDFAEELRVASWAFLTDEALACLLLKEAADATSISYEKLFGAPISKRWLDRPLEGSRPPGFRAEALEHLRRLHHERVDRVRHDRARDKLWQHFVWKLIPIVYALHFGCLYLMAAPRPLLPVAAGAIGSMLSAVFKLRDGEQRIRHLRRSVSFMLLQPMIGATAALVMMWLGVTNVLKLDPGNTSATAVVGFLAGFSEPFFLGTIGRLSEAASSNAKPKPADAEDDGAGRKAHS